MSLPTQIRKRDGHLVSFQPEKISRTLFALTEELGSPDSFLANELTDGVLHFLEHELDAESLTTERLAELVVKTVRELGHPAIAKRFEENTRQAADKPTSLAPKVDLSVPRLDQIPVHGDYWIARQHFIDYSLKHVYPQDVVAAHRDGFLELLDLGSPTQISAAVLSPNAPLPLDYWKLFECLNEARFTTGWLVAIDGLEHSLAAHPSLNDEFVRGYLSHVQRCLDLNKLFARINLNCAVPPPWAASASGPLFPDSTCGPSLNRLDGISEQIVEQYRLDHRAFINWHLSARDLEPTSGTRLMRIATMALRIPRIQFVFDRPGQPIALDVGLERGGPVILGRVRLVLNRFVEMLGGGPMDPEAYLKKLTTLARFAKRAGCARQDYLRRFGCGELGTGFILERGQFVVLHKALIEAAMKVLGPSADEPAVVELGQRSLGALQAGLDDRSLRPLACRLDWESTFDHPAGDELSMFEMLGEGNDIWQRQLRHASRLGQSSSGGILTIPTNRIGPEGIQQVVDALRAAWRSNVSCVRLDPFHDDESRES